MCLTSKKKSPELILRNLLQVSASMGAVIVCDYSLRKVSIQGTKWAALLKCKTNAGLKITLLFSCFFACGLRWPIGYKLSTNASDINSISAQKTVGSMLKVLWGLNSKMKNIKNDWCVVTHWLILLKMTFSCAIYGLLLIWTVTFTALLHWSKQCATHAHFCNTFHVFVNYFLLISEISTRSCKMISGFATPSFYSDSMLNTFNNLLF